MKYKTRKSDILGTIFASVILGVLAFYLTGYWIDRL